jgi:hypothetical protein
LRWLQDNRIREYTALFPGSQTRGWLEKVDAAQISPEAWGHGIMKVPFCNSDSSLKRKVVLCFVWLLLFYAVFGFWILPVVVRVVAVKVLSRQLDREVFIQKVKINPFALSTTVDGLLIKEKDGSPFISWDEVYVNFQLSSFFGKAWVFKEICATKPFVHVRMNKDYTLNFSDLVTKFSSNSAPQSSTPSKPLALRVERFHIGGATAALADYTTRTPFKRRVGPIDITLENFRTDPDNKNQYSFTGTTDAGERISWNGYFSLSPLRSQGDLTLDKMTLNKYAALYQDLVRFEIRSGVLGLHVDYQMEFSADNHSLSVNRAALSLRDFKLGVPGNTNNIMELPFFSVTGARADLQSRQASVDVVVTDGSKLDLVRSKDASINVVDLSKPAATAANAPGGILLLLRSVTNAVAMLLNSTNQWSATVRSVSSTHGAILFEDDVNSRPAKVALSDISILAKNISNLPGTNFTSQLSLRWNQNGSIKTETTASLTPPTFEVQMDLDQIDLGTLDPYLEPKLDLFILGSKLGLHGRVHLRTPRGELPIVTFRGDASLDGFRAVDGVTGEDLLKWDSVHLNGIHANLNPPTMDIKQIAVDSVSANLVIETNHTINLLNALRLTNTSAVAVDRTNANETVALKNPEMNPGPSSGLSAALKSDAARNAPLERIPQITIGEVVITNTSASFTDRSVTPVVSLAVEQINGLITGLSTEQLQHADVNVGAEVEGIGPARITGKINPFSQQMTNEIKVSLEGMDLTPASPYVVKYAGFQLAEGKLNLDLNYQVVGRELRSKNVITLDQFTFGEKVPGPDATHLPVRLAVAILKDRDGKIILDVPIEGSLDDPRFRIGKVVLRVIVNILEKVATSPFSLLGAAFGGGGEELSYQDFAPGSTELSAEDRQKLDQLGKALFERPGLQLEISGSVAPDADREGLQRAALDHEIRTRIWQKLRDSERATNSVDQIALTPEVRADWISTIYADALNDGRITPELIAANTNLAYYIAKSLPPQTEIHKNGALLVVNATSQKPDTNTPVYRTNLVPTPSPMEAVLLVTYTIGPGDLETLAFNRAEAVQFYLSRTTKIEATRLFLTTKGATLRTDGSRAYLQFR